MCFSIFLVGSTRYFFGTGTVGTLKKKYWHRSVGTFISQVLGGTRYFCNIFYNFSSAAWPSGSERRCYDGHDRKVDGLNLTQASLLRP